MSEERTGPSAVGSESIDRLRIHGRLVAHAERRRHLANHDPADDVYVFHAARWSVLRVSRHERYDETDDFVAGSTLVSVGRYDSVDELAAIEGRYGAIGWDDLLDDIDGVAEPGFATRRIDRDFAKASIYNKGPGAVHRAVDRRGGHPGA